MSKKLLTADTQVYSNSEWTFTGKYDTRGYKIYRKVFSGTSSWGTCIVEFNDDTIDRVWIDNSSSWYYTAGCFFSPNMHGGNNDQLYYSTTAKCTKTSLDMYVGQYLTGGSYQYYMVIECTRANGV